MAMYPKELEVQRLHNLAINFGWEKVKEEVEGDEVFVTFKKKIEGDEMGVSEAPPS
jgi:hypothetical protein